ncbi:MAG: hypothetical protein AAF215_04335 [Cyanobacteria bacterium P01_A01_bin.123]
MTRSPHRKHQQVADSIYSAVDVWSEASGFGEATPAPEMIPSEANNAK